jgi:1-acyl-sn-glycerol-3-phosphate acyltransferase
LTEPSRLPAAGSNHPRWHKPRLTNLARKGLTAAGWTVNNPFPDVPRSIVIVAPHTSNWDFIVAVAVSFALDIRPRFIGKHTLFRWPLGIIMRSLGGIPVNRSSTEGMVPRTASLVREYNQIALGITPEGTRKSTSRWRTGYYHIAAQAGVPIIPCYLSLTSKSVGFGEPIVPSDNMEKDLERIAEFFSPHLPKT